MDASVERLERLLALILIQNSKSQTEKIMQLNMAGFSNLEIADLIGTTNAVVAQIIYAGKKEKRKKK
jgi:hypothetical protein